MEQQQELLRRSRAASAQFIQVEIEFLHSMLDCARSALTADHRDQYMADADRAFETIERLLPRLALGEKEEAYLRGRINRLTYRYRTLRFSNGKRF
jgi:hypothetical protein